MEKKLKILLSLVVLGSGTVQSMDYIWKIFESVVRMSMPFGESSDDESDDSSSLGDRDRVALEKSTAIVAYSPLSAEYDELFVINDDSQHSVLVDLDSDDLDLDYAARAIYKEQKIKRVQQENMTTLLGKIREIYGLKEGRVDEIFIRGNAHLFPTVLEKNSWWDTDSQELVLAEYPIIEKTITGYSCLFGRINMVSVKIGGRGYERMISPNESLQQDELKKILDRKWQRAVSGE